MSSITFAGNLAADPELQYTPSGRAVTTFTVIENRRRRTLGDGWEDDEPNVFRVQAWGRTAENVKASCHKGDRVHVAGRIETQRWTDKSTGADRTGQRITADEVAFSLKYHTVAATKNERTTQSDDESAEPVYGWEVAQIPTDEPF